MAEELKDLGGLVNKDMAFSKVQPNVVYDSKNFRVTTDDGATLAVRSTIKGNSFSLQIPDVPCKRTIQFDLDRVTRGLFTLQGYSMDFFIEFTSTTTTFSFTYNGVNQLLQDFVTFVQNDAAFIANNITVIGGTYSIINEPDTFIGNVSLEVPFCGSIQIGPLISGGSINDTSLGYTPIDENFQNIIPFTGIYPPFNNALNPFTFTGAYPTLGAASGNSSTFRGATDQINQWGIENRYCNPTFTQLAVATRYMFVNMSTGAFDSGYNLIGGSSTDTTLLYNEVWNTGGAVNSIPNTAIISKTVLGEGLFTNIEDYTALIWNYDFSYATGNVDLSAYDLYLKVYLYMGDAWNDPTLPYEYPDTGVGGFLDGTKPCALIYNQALNPDANYLKSSGYNITGNIIFGDTPFNNGATENPVYIIYIEPVLSTVSGHNYSVELYLDYFKVTAPAINLTIATVINDYAGVSAPILIGWTTLREDIYLFTTSNQQNPEAPNYQIGDGQIWRFTYDKTGDYSNPNIYNIDLVYNNAALDFTTWHPIANPGMIEARYENEDVQKIYWTDNYNVPRQINVAPSQAAITTNLTVSQLNLIPALTMELPYITQIIDGGNLRAGVYQVIYRLQNLNNSETRFSRPSNSIPLFETSMSTGFYGFYPGAPNVNSTINYPTSGTPPTGTPINSGKAIQVQINNLDTTYNEIEFATIYYKNDTDVPEINIVKKEAIPANGKISTIIDGKEDLVAITLGESTAFTTAIRRCKTLTAKKQTLFLGNLTVAGQDVEYDTRVYRFPINSTTTTIYDSQNNSYTVAIDGFLGYIITEVNGTAVFNPYNIPADHDCIQNYSSQNPAADTNLLYKYNSNVLGGSGPNLEYEFYTDTFVLDGVDVNGGNDRSNPSMAPFPNDFVAFNSLATTPYFQTGTFGSFTNYTSPYRYDTFVGYRRDEMYRFGMVFYDELDNPTYVNWIGDIRMPHIWMPDTTFNANSAYVGSGKRTRIGVDQFNSTFCSDLTFYDTNNGFLYAKPLALKVNILNNPSSLFTHGSIVRAERADQDKHILGQGLLRPAYRAGTSSPKNADHAFLSPPSRLGNTYGPDGVNNPWWHVWSMNSPEFQNWNDGDSTSSAVTPPGYTNGDSIDFLGILQADQYYWPQWDDNGIQSTNNATGIRTEIIDNGACGNDDYLYYAASINKYYINKETSTIPHTIKSSSANQIINLTSTQKLGNVCTASNKYGSASLNSKYVVQSTPFALYGTSQDSPAYDFTPNPNSCQYNSGYSGGDFLIVSCTGPTLALGLDGGPSSWNWDVAGSNNFFSADEYLDNTTSAADDYIKAYFGNYKRNIAPNSEYGGNSYFSRASTEYIFCNNFFRISPTSGTSTIVYGGDTIVTLMDNVLDFFDGQGARAITRPRRFLNGHNWAQGVTCYAPYGISAWRAAIFPVETSIPVNYRRSKNYVNRAYDSTIEVPNRMTTFTKTSDPWNQTGAGFSWDNNLRLEEIESFKIDKVFLYNYVRSIYRFFPKQPNTIVPSTYDCRIWRSQEKTDGEQVESWSIYKPSLYKDVESAYGPINNMLIFQDKMFYFQDRGFGIAQVDEQKVMQSANPTDADLVLGSSGILERYDYISTKTGTKHQFSMSVSDYSIIWFDILARKMYRYKPDGLIPVSDVKGLNAYLHNKLFGTLQTSDNPYRFVGIHSTYDFRHNEFYMTFLDHEGDQLEMTLVYNDLLDGYVGEYTHYPKVYINDKLNIFSPNPNVILGDDNEELYIHNYGNYVTFYDQSPDFSSLSFILNSNPTVEKVLNNLEFVVESFKNNRQEVYEPQYDAVAQIDFYDFFNDMRVYNNYQNTDWFALIPNRLDYSSRTNYARKHKSIWNTRVPSDKVLDVNISIFNPANLTTIKPSMTRRFKDKWFIVELRYDNTTYNNSLNNRLVVHSAKATYALNSR